MKNYKLLKKRTRNNIILFDAQYTFIGVFFNPNAFFGDIIVSSVVAVLYNSAFKVYRYHLPQSYFISELCLEKAVVYFIRIIFDLNACMLTELHTHAHKQIHSSNQQVFVVLFLYHGHRIVRCLNLILSTLKCFTCTPPSR